MKLFILPYLLVISFTYTADENFKNKTCAETAEAKTACEQIQKRQIKI